METSNLKKENNKIKVYSPSAQFFRPFNFLDFDLDPLAYFLTPYIFFQQENDRKEPVLKHQVHQPSISV